MLGTTAREILDKAILLKEGGKIITKCEDYSEMESLRTNLYKARNALLKKHRSLAYSLYISREKVDDDYLVTITKEVVIVEDGKVRPFERDEVSLMGEENERR